jgi:hypothetical protein
MTTSPSKPLNPTMTVLGTNGKDRIHASFWQPVTTHSRNVRTATLLIS